MINDLIFILVFVCLTLVALWIGWQLGNVTRRVWKRIAKGKTNETDN